MFRRTICLSVLLLLGLMGCSGQSGWIDTSMRAANDRAKIDSGRLQLTGSSTMGPLLAQIAERFEKLHPGVRIDVQTGGSSRGISDAARGLADIGMSSRELKPSEHPFRLPE